MGFIFIFSVNDVGIYLALYLMRWMGWGHIIATDRWTGAGDCLAEIQYSKLNMESFKPLSTVCKNQLALMRSLLGDLCSFIHEDPGSKIQACKLYITDVTCKKVLCALDH